MIYIGYCNSRQAAPSTSFSSYMHVHLNLWTSPSPYWEHALSLSMFSLDSCTCHHMFGRHLCPLPSVMHRCAGSCPIEGMTKCGACSAGFHLTDDHTCAVNECQCANGEASTGVACPEHGADECESCNANYHKKRVGEMGVESSESICVL